MTHEPIEALLKFADAKSGLQMLADRELHYDAPSLLNDPFQPDHNTELTFSREDLLSALIRQVVVLIFAQKAPEPPYNTLTRAICRWREEQRFDIEEEAEEVLRDLLERMSEQQEDGIKELMTAWREFAMHSHLCRFHEKNNSLHTWELFAAQHSGIALKFKCGSEYSIKHVRAVEYHDAPPMITTLKEQLDGFFDVQPLTFDNESFELKLCTQPRHRRLDKEWRGILTNKPSKRSASDRPITQGPAIAAEESHIAQETNASTPAQSTPPITEASESVNHAVQPFNEDDLKAVYLGLRTSNADKESVKSILRADYPQVKLYQALRHKGQYALEFESIALR